MSRFFCSSMFSPTFKPVVREVLAHGTTGVLDKIYVPGSPVATATLLGSGRLRVPFFVSFSLFPIVRGRLHCIVDSLFMCRFDVGCGVQSVILRCGYVEIS